MNETSPSICVVIPHYQRSPEPLRDAIQSILDQQGVDMPYIVVVDDFSPYPAKKIIDEYFSEYSAHIRIILQNNGGAANARNTGLDNIPESANYVAFLDSDDAWVQDHLANAVSLLEQGCDFYFADHKREEWDEGKFARVELSLDRHKCLDKAGRLYEYCGDLLFAVMNDHLIQTSTVVFRKHLMEDIRFPVDLVLGEDEVFWVKAMRRARKIGFCSTVGVRMGKGVNISQGGDWGDERSFQLMAQNVRYWQSVPALLPNEPQIEPLRRLKIGQLRQNFAASVWYRLRRGKGLPMRHIASFTSADPGWLFSLWTVLVRRLADGT